MSKTLGTEIVKASLNLVELIRRTKETEVRCKVEKGPRREWKIETGLDFFNHMIEMFAYYTEFNIDVTVKCPRFTLVHTIIEDTGITLGRAFYELIMKRGEEKGVRSFGFSQCILDEAFAQARVSFEGRAGCYVHREVRRFGIVENIQEEFMESFFQGFAQGMKITIHLDLLKGEDPHHLWEAVFRAFGEALRQALEINEWRRKGIAGIKGTVE